MSMNPTAASRAGFVPGSLRGEEQLPEGEQRTALVLLVASFAVLVAIFWNQFALTKEFWNDDTYSHGWLIPYIALFLLWVQRLPRGGPITEAQETQNLKMIGAPLAVAVGCYLVGEFAKLPLFFALGWLAYAVSLVVGMGVVFRFHTFEQVPAYQRWVGAALVLSALGLRIYATLRDVMPFDRISFMLALFGIFLMCGGFAIVQRMWASIAFFIFMFPLPSAVENRALPFLQKLAAMVSTFVLQVFGMAAYREGNTLNVDGMPLEVAQACSGLRMLTIFCAMVIALVIVIERPWWDKVLLLLSAVPIALATNIIRIVITALLFKLVEGTSMEKPMHDYIHDYAGYAMIFIAAAIMWVEYKILASLAVEEGEETLQSASFLGQAKAGGR